MGKVRKFQAKVLFLSNTGKAVQSDGFHPLPQVEVGLRSKELEILITDSFSPAT